MIQVMALFCHVNHIDFYLRGAMKCEKEIQLIRNLNKIKKDIHRKAERSLNQ